MSTARATDADRLARVALSQLGEPGDMRISGLADELGAEALRDHLVGERDTAGLRTEVSSRLGDLDPERDLDRAARLGIRFVVPGDAEWPYRVDDLDRAEPVGRVGRAPLGLWVRGPLRLTDLAGGVAVVGSRSSTTYGEGAALDLAAALAQTGRCVISGGAFGIDLAAHRGALAAEGPTAAVLACGVDRAYPADHRPLLQHLAREHAVISEVAPGRAPMRSRFLTRNRVIAALGVGTVVVEAALRSGALNTANWTTRLNRVLMAVPGPITSAPSQGVHQLVRTGAAALVTSGPEVLEMVGAVGTDLLEPPRGPERPRDRLTGRQQRVLEAVPLSTGARTDAVARTAGLGVMHVRSTLDGLQLLGLVRIDEDGWRLAGRALPQRPGGRLA